MRTTSIQQHSEAAAAKVTAINRCNLLISHHAVSAAMFVWQTPRQAPRLNLPKGISWFLMWAQCVPIYEVVVVATRLCNTQQAKYGDRTVKFCVSIALAQVYLIVLVDMYIFSVSPTVWVEQCFPTYTYLKFSAEFLWCLTISTSS